MSNPESKLNVVEFKFQKNKILNPDRTRIIIKYESVNISGDKKCAGSDFGLEDPEDSSCSGSSGTADTN